MKNAVNKKHLLIIALLAGLMALYFIVNFNYPLVSDSLIFDDIAQNLAHGYGFTETSLIHNSKILTMGREPLYPALMAIIYSIAGINYTAVYAVQGLIFILTAIFTYLTAYSIFKNSNIAFIAGIFVALNPSLGNYVNHILSENLFTFLVILTIFFLCHAQNTGFKKYFLLGGITLGLATLTRSFIFIYLPVIVIVLIFILAKNKLEKKIIIKLILLFLAGTTIVTFPWLFRNYTQLNAFSFATRGGVLVNIRANELRLKKAEKMPYMLSAFSEKLARKFYPDVDVTSLAMKCDKQSLQLYKDYTRKGIPPAKADKKLMNDAIKTILNNFPEYLMFSAVNIIKMNKTFHLPSLPRTENQLSNTSVFYIKLITKVLFYLTLLLGFIGLILDRKNYINWLIPFSYILFDNSIHSLTYCIPRYAVPIYPLYLMFAALGLYKIYHLWLIKTSAMTPKLSDNE
jgi:4-amino-4-deoxy-L-arabinose transferase-like glycosyltransferase